jgi:hypothetical protein
MLCCSQLRVGRRQGESGSDPWLGGGVPDSVHVSSTLDVNTGRWQEGGWSPVCASWP